MQNEKIFNGLTSKQDSNINNQILMQELPSESEFDNSLENSGISQ